MKKITGLLIALLAFFNSAHASHLLGGYIRYDYLSNNKYGVYLIIYRDCNGIAFSTADPLTITFNDKSGTKLGSDTVYAKKRISLTDVTYSCKWSTKYCIPSNTVGTGSGIERHVYYVEIDMYSTRFKSLYTNSKLCEILFSWTQCCRSGAITTGMAGQGFYIESSLKLCTSSGTQLNIVNSSPLSFYENRTSLCCNYRAKLFLGGFDTTDLDSISYSLVPAKTSATASATYSSPFTYQYPATVYCSSPSTIKCTPTPTSSPPKGFYFDSTTGFSVFTPIKCDEVFVIAVKTKEFRKINSNWELVGTTLTDREFMVADNCGYNYIPKFTVPSNDSLTLKKKYSLYVTSKDDTGSISKVIDTTVITFFNLPSGAVYKRNSPFHAYDSGYLTWTPGVEWSERTYKLLVGVNDNNCPVPFIDLKLMYLRFNKVRTNYIVKTYIDKNHNCKRDSNELPAKGVWFYMEGQKAGLNEFYKTNDSGKVAISTSYGPRNILIVPGLDYYSTCTGSKVNYIDKKDTTVYLDIPVRTRAYISGRFFHDQDSDCIKNKAADVYLSNKQIGDKTTGKYTSTDDSGYFKLYLDSGIYSLNLPAYISTTSCGVSSKIKNIKLLLDSFVKLGDMGVYNNMTDLSTDIYNTRAVRGKDLNITITIKNNGSNSLKKFTGGSYPNVNLKYDKKLVFISCGGSCSNDTANGVLSWTLHDINNGDTSNFKCTFNINNTKFNAGDYFKLLSWIDTSFHDYIYTNNSSYERLKVLSPYDPNAKICLTGDTGVNNENISYRIDFQNIGTDTAYDIVVKDSLQTDLDYTTIESFRSSFPFHLEQKKNILYFMFHGIKLPDSTKNKEGSKGFISFTVSPNMPTNSDLKIFNFATITFDYEVPVKTNVNLYATRGYTRITKTDKTKYCGETSVKVFYKNNFNSTIATLRLELSDSAGLFTSPVYTRQWTELPDDKEKSLSFTLPNDLKGSKKYQVRIVPISPIKSEFVIPSASFEVENVPGILTTDKSAYCEGDSIIIVLKNSPYFDVWFNGSKRLYNAGPGKYYFYPVIAAGSLIEYTAFSNSGCTKSRKLTQTVNLLPTFTSSLDNDTICPGSSTFLNLSGSHHYHVTYNSTILFDSVSSGKHVLNPYTKLDYMKIIGYSQVGCHITKYSKLPVKESHLFKFSISDSLLCRGKITSITLSGMDKYSAIMGSNYLFKNVPSGNYAIVPPANPSTIKVLAWTNKQCPDSGYLKSPTFDNPIKFTAISSKDTLCMNDSSELTINGAFSYDLFRNNVQIADKIKSGILKLEGGKFAESVDVYAIYPHGCTDTAHVFSPVIENYEKMEAYITKDTLCKNDSTSLYLKYRSNYDIFTNYQKTAGNISAGEFKIQSYPKPTSVSVYGFTKRGCIDSITLKAPIQEIIKPKLELRNFPTPACEIATFDLRMRNLEFANLYQNSTQISTLKKDSWTTQNNIGAGKWMYYTSGKSIRGCTYFSDSQTVIVNKNPSKPIVTITGNKLTSNAPFGNQWYYGNGIPTGLSDTQNTYSPSKTSFYFTRITDKNNCINQSDSVQFFVNGLIPITIGSDIQVFPNPFNNSLNIISSIAIQTIEIFAIDGKLIELIKYPSGALKESLNTSKLISGLYFIRLTTKDATTVVFKLQKEN